MAAVTSENSEIEEEEGRTYDKQREQQEMKTNECKHNHED